MGIAISIATGSHTTWKIDTTHGFKLSTAGELRVFYVTTLDLLFASPLATAI